MCHNRTNPVFMRLSNDLQYKKLHLLQSQPYNFVKPDFTVLIVLNPVFVLGLMIFKNDLTRKLTHF